MIQNLEKLNVMKNVFLLAGIFIIINSCAVNKGIGNNKEYLGMRPDSIYLTLDTLLGNNLFRPVIYRNFDGIVAATASSLSVSGTVVSKVCVNRAGKVVYAEIIEEHSSIDDHLLRMQILNGIMGYKYAKNDTFPEFQCGKLIVTLDIQRNGKLKEGIHNTKRTN